MESSGPNSVVVNSSDCPIRIQEYEFLGDLIEFSFREFDVILGMDWLSRHQVVVDYRMKRVTLRTLSGKEVTFIGERSNHLSNVISTTIARTMDRKGWLTIWAPKSIKTVLHASWPDELAVQFPTNRSD